LGGNIYADLATSLAQSCSSGHSGLQRSGRSQQPGWTGYGNPG